ncbi:MAG: 4-hydroxy-tetrahydrodipicolinate synthase [Deltaproteobacteria bacterium]|nr:4-hydroxy-tetrahydrodipicolinate synthase [Deltaproteobacteria bacterium]
MNKIEIKGLYPAIILPFNDDDSINLEGFKENVQYLVDADCSGVCVNGSTGEAINLTREERIHVIQAAKEIAPEGFTIIAGTGAPTTRMAIQQTQDAKDAGADVALVITPYYCIPNKEGLITHYREVCKVDMPILLYNLPEHTGCEIDLDTLETLSKIENIVGMKESSGDLSYFAHAVQITPDDFVVMSGADDRIFLTKILGGSAHILALGNLAPHKIIEMMKAVDEGDMEKAKELHFRLLDLAEAILAAENFPAPIKEAARILGRVSSNPRLPTMPVDQEESSVIHKALSKAGLI